MRDPAAVHLAHRGHDLFDDAQPCVGVELVATFGQEPVETNGVAVMFEHHRRAELGLVEIDRRHDPVDLQVQRRQILAFGRSPQRGRLLTRGIRRGGIDPNPRRKLRDLVGRLEILGGAALGKGRKPQLVGAGGAGASRTLEPDAGHRRRQLVGLRHGDTAKLRVRRLGLADLDDRLAQRPHVTGLVVVVRDRDLAEQLGRQPDTQVRLGEPHERLDVRIRRRPLPPSPIAFDEARDTAGLLLIQLSDIAVRHRRAVTTLLHPRALIAGDPPRPRLDLDEKHAFGRDHQRIGLVDTAAVGELEVRPHPKRVGIGQEGTQRIERVGFPGVLGRGDLLPAFGSRVHRSSGDTLPRRGRNGVGEIPASRGWGLGRGTGRGAGGLRFSGVLYMRGAIPRPSCTTLPA